MKDSLYWCCCCLYITRKTERVWMLAYVMKSCFLSINYNFLWPPKMRTNSKLEYLSQKSSSFNQSYLGCLLEAPHKSLAHLCWTAQPICNSDARTSGTTVHDIMLVILNSTAKRFKPEPEVQGSVDTIKQPHTSCLNDRLKNSTILWEKKTHPCMPILTLIWYLLTTIKHSKQLLEAQGYLKR